MKEKILQLLRETDGFLSGQEISKMFGVTRTSVWKAIRQLEEMGYEIEAVRNRGYHLCSEPDFLTNERIREYLDTAWAGHPVQVCDSVDSTNNEAKRRAESGASQGLLVISEQQTAGRGRHGRAWDSKKGEGIFMSLLLRPDIEPAHASMLTLVMGMAVRDALEMTVRDAQGMTEREVPERIANKVPEMTECESPDVQIKWPNDIICSGKKICGILTEMSAQVDCINHIVIGVGINVHNQEFPEEVRQTATSVYLETGTHICRARLAARCMCQFEGYYARFLETQDLSGLMEEYNTRLVNCGRQVRVLDFKENYTGLAKGINAEGELLVETEDGLKCVAAGEVSVRGVYGYV
ncbi:MAG: biotin--[acetyl-CoA-carboxylase] ligase [Lachnospiraceae bacterium]|nr:biotin--[acetyl-CoA-carboxylase] ligase [Lachnospiraceae bacterium]